MHVSIASLSARPSPFWRWVGVRIDSFEMRVDLFLKASRLCPRRTVAQKLCDAGLVFVNGHSAKSSHSVKPGDEVDLRRRNQLIKVRVLAVPATRQTPRKEAGELYEILTEEFLHGPLYD